MSPELATQLLQFGIGGIFLYYLWRENQELRGNLYTERERHRAEVAKLREDIAERDRLRFKEATDYGTTLWQFTQSVKDLAEHVRRQARTGGAQIDRQDD